jgi:lysozyme
MSATATPAKYDPDTLKDELIVDEGDKRLLYKDTLGHTTGGIGHNFDVAMTVFMRDAIYDCDVAGCEASLDLHAPWWRTLDPVRQRVIMNMIFNMGWGDGKHGLSSFTNTLADIQKGLYASAAKNMLASTWAKEVGARATRLAYMMSRGQVMPDDV